MIYDSEEADCQTAGQRRDGLVTRHDGSGRTEGRTEGRTDGGTEGRREGRRDGGPEGRREGRTA